MRVAGHGGDTWEGEIEVWDGVAELLGEREDEAAEAAVDVEADGVGDGEGGETRDVVDDALGEGGGRGVKEDSVGGYSGGDGVDVDLGGVVLMC